MLGLSAQWCHRSSLSVPLLSTFNLIAKCCCSLPVAFNSKFVTCTAHWPVPGARVCNPESMWGGIHWNHNEVPLREVLSIFPRQVPYTSAKLGRIEVQSLCLLPCMHAVHAERVDAKLWFLRERCTRIHTAVAAQIHTGITRSVQWAAWQYGAVLGECCPGGNAGQRVTSYLTDITTEPFTSVKVAQKENAKEKGGSLLLDTDHVCYNLTCTISPASPGF